MAFQLSVLAILSLIFTCAALSIGLTYLPCYSSVCSEEFFPYETRVHIAIFYALLLSLAILFYLRAHWRGLEQFSKKPISTKRLPLLGVRATCGGLLITIWLLFVILATTAVWLDIVPFWNQQLTGLSNGQGASISTTVTAIIGHHIDLILGLLIIPVPRHSVLCKAFGFPPSTLLWAHKALAYLLLIGMIAHAAAYFSFIASLLQNTLTEQASVSKLNPYWANATQAKLGAYSLLNFPTGIASLVLIIIITVTALGWMRRRHYEIFYYLHVLLGVLFMIFACIHANTDFYCLLPGLVLWAYDWAWRLWGGAGLSRSRLATIENAQNGWTRVTLLPSKNDSSNKATSTKSLGHSTRNPLQTYYINLPSASKLQSHAMSSISAGSTQETQFLFRTCVSRTKTPQWTSRVADISDLELSQTVVRLEGPYTPNLPVMDEASHIVCFVGGTGITGALSIADWWIHKGSSATNLSIYWTVRTPEMAQLPEWLSLCELAKEQPSLHLTTHITSKLGRLDLKGTLRNDIAQTKQQNQSSWVYISGPEGLLNDGEDACLALKQEMNKSPANSGNSIDWYAARWEV